MRKLGRRSANAGSWRAPRDGPPRGVSRSGKVAFPHDVTRTERTELARHA